AVTNAIFGDWLALGSEAAVAPAAILPMRRRVPRGGWMLLALPRPTRRARRFMAVICRYLPVSAGICRYLPVSRGVSSWTPGVSFNTSMATACRLAAGLPQPRSASRSTGWRCTWERDFMLMQPVRIFINHTPEDDGFCQELAATLRAAGADVW